MYKYLEETTHTSKKQHGSKSEINKKNYEHNFVSILIEKVFLHIITSFVCEESMYTSIMVRFLRKVLGSAI